MQISALWKTRIILLANAIMAVVLVIVAWGTGSPPEWFGEVFGTLTAVINIVLQVALTVPEVPSGESR